jgi:hypothetical protein
MFVELKGIDNIAKFYFRIVSVFSLSIAVSALAKEWSFRFGLFCLGLSFLQFFIAYGLLQRKKWGLKLARGYVTILHPKGFPCRTTPFAEWLADVKDPRLDQYFK